MGADVNEKNNGGETAIDFILKREDIWDDEIRIEKFFPIISLLIKHGATISEESLSRVPSPYKEQIQDEVHYRNRFNLIKLRKHLRNTNKAKEANNNAINVVIDADLEYNNQRSKRGGTRQNKTVRRRRNKTARRRKTRSRR